MVENLENKEEVEEIGHNSTSLRKIIASLILGYISSGLFFTILFIYTWIVHI